MAKDKEKKVAVEEQPTQESNSIRENNLMSDTVVQDALKAIEKERDEKKVRELKRTICQATYLNAKTRLQLQQRRREDDITKEKLTATMHLLERLVGSKAEIQKNGKLSFTKEKIDQKDLLTPTEFSREKDNLNKEFRKKSTESDKKFEEELQELRNSYEGEYCWYRDWD